MNLSNEKNEDKKLKTKIFDDMPMNDLVKHTSCNPKVDYNENYISENRRPTPTFCFGFINTNPGKSNKLITKNKGPKNLVKVKLQKTHEVKGDSCSDLSIIRSNDPLSRRYSNRRREENMQSEEESMDENDLSGKFQLNPIMIADDKISDLSNPNENSSNTDMNAKLIDNEYLEPKSKTPDINMSRKINGLETRKLNKKGSKSDRYSSDKKNSNDLNDLISKVPVMYRQNISENQEKNSNASNKNGTQTNDENAIQAKFLTKILKNLQKIRNKFEKLLDEKRENIKSR